MTRPHTQIFVDVDGVINAQPDSATDLAGWPADSWRRESVFLPTVGHGDLTWSTDVIDHLRSLEATPGVEMTWCTTWQDLVYDQLCPRIGIGDDWPVAMDGSEVRDGPLDWWKANRVHRGLRQPSGRVVWIDDEISDWEAIQMLAGREESLKWLYSDRVLAICPRSQSGLTKPDLGRIETFLN